MLYSMGWSGLDKLTTDAEQASLDPLLQPLLNSSHVRTGSGTVTGVAGDVFVLGQSGNDVLYGVSGNIGISGGAGDDTLVGSLGNDVLDGGTGNDVLYGGTGNDTYLFNLGDGQDTIFDWDGTSGNVDTIRFGAGIAASDILFTRNGSDLVLRINGTNDQMSIQYWGYAYGAYYRSIEQVKFADGTTWDTEYLEAQTVDLPIIGTNGDDYLLYGDFGNDTFDGRAGNETFDGRAGNDYLSGGDGNDILDGGTGNDYLNGGTGNDTYLFNMGGGQDTIFDYDENFDEDRYRTGNNVDTIRFGVGIAASDITFARNGNDLVLGINGTTDQVTIQNWGAGNDYRIEQVKFADGTTWDAAYLLVRSVSIPIIGTPGDDILYGDAGNNTLNGGTGNDSLNDWLGGNDTYLFNLGGGQDTVCDWSPRAGNIDTIRFGAGIAASDITFSRNGFDLVLGINGTTDQVTIEYWGYENSYHIEEVKFADGTVWDAAYLQAQAVELPFVGTDGADYLRGWSGGGAVLQGLGGNDTLCGGDGNDTLAGGTGNDVLYGGDGDSDYRFNVGGGANGNDTYLFNLGDGQDTIYDGDPTTGNVDTIRFGAGIAASDIIFTRNDGDMVLGINGTTDQVTIKNWGYGNLYHIEQVKFSDGTVWDAAYLQAQAVELPFLGTDGADSLRGWSGGGAVLQGLGGNDTLYGGDGNDTLDGGTGNDYLNGGIGYDTYLFNLGDGQDTIYDGDSTLGNFDTICFGVGIAASDIIFSRNGYDLVLGISGTMDQVTIQAFGGGNIYRIEQVKFADGTVWNAAYLQTQLDEIHLVGTDGDDSLYGSIGNDTLDGGTGNDWLVGYAGNDTYLFNLGDGQDTIYDYDWTAGNVDTILFGAGIAASDITVARNGNDVVLSVNGTTDQVTIRSWSIEQVKFADGTVWDAAYLHAQISAVPIIGTNGNDYLYGDGGDNTLNGGTGNDYLAGGSGNDTYLFNLGDGQDVINDFDGRLSNVDTIRFGAGIAASDITFARNGNDLVLGINGTSDQVTIQNWGSGNDYRIEQVKFADGTKWDAAYLQAQVAQTPLIGTSGNDSLIGEAGNNTLIGNGGLDTLDGDAGNDTIYVGDHVSPGLSVVSVEDDGTIPSATNTGLATNYFLHGTISDTNSLGGYDYDFFKLENLSAGALLSSATFSDFDTVMGLYDSTGNLLISNDDANGAISPNRLNSAFQFTIPTDGNYYLAVASYDSWLPTDPFNASSGGGDVYEKGDYVATVSFSGSYITPASSIITGGLGNDVIYGGVGNDIYQFSLGDGQDTITDHDATAGNIDVLSLKDAIPTNTSLSRNGDDLLVNVGTAGDSVTIKNWWLAGDTSYRMEQITFSDGTVWNEGTIEGMFNAPSNAAPVVAVPLLDQALTQGQNFQLVVPAGTFTDVNTTSGDTLTYAATLADSTALPSWLTFDAATQTFSGTPGNADVGNLNLMVTAIDTGGLSATSTFAVNVANVNDTPVVSVALADQATQQDASFSFNVPAGTFSDADIIHGDTLTYAATLADGSVLPSWLTFDPATLTFSGTPGNADVGSLNLVVTATDTGGMSASSSFALNAANVNDAPTGAVTITGTATQNQTLTASNDLADADGLGTIAYQWQSSTDGTTWTNITGATAGTFTLAETQVGKQVRAVASYTDGHGTAESVSSTATAVIDNVMLGQGHSVLTDDGHGDVTTTNYDANGNKLSDNWTKAHNLYGNDTFNADGSSSGAVHNPDGSYSNYTSDGHGIVNTVNYDADGAELGYNTHTGDGNGNSTTVYFSTSGNKLKDSWVKSDGTSGSDIFNADGSYSNTIKDGYGEGTDYYDASGNRVSDSYRGSDGYYSNDMYNADGSSSGSFYDPSGYYGNYTNNADGSGSNTRYNPDGSYYIYTDDGHGTSSQRDYDANGDLTGSYNIVNDGMGNFTTMYFDAYGIKLSDIWAKADGTNGNDTFNPDGSSSGTVSNPDGSSNSYTNDGPSTGSGGDITTTHYDANGNELGYSTSITDVQGNLHSINYDVNGNMLGRSVLTNDGQGIITTVTFDVSGTELGYSTHAVETNGNSTTVNYDVSSNKLSDNWKKSGGTSGSDIFNSDGSSSGTARNQDGSYSNYTNDGHGIVNTVNYDASGTELGCSTLTGDGNGGGTIVNYDASAAEVGYDFLTVDGNGAVTTVSYDISGIELGYSIQTGDGNGNSTTMYFNTNGNKLRGTWIKSDGTSGGDIFNADGSYSNTIKDKYGEYTDDYDANGNRVSYSWLYWDGSSSGTNTYNADGSSSFSWQFRDGSNGTETYNANGSGSGARYNADGSYYTYTDTPGNNYDEIHSEFYAANGNLTGSSTSTSDLLGNSMSVNYDANGNKTDDSWDKADGSSGVDTFNAGGSSSGTIFKPDFSRSTYTNDGHGDITTTNYDANSNEIGYNTSINDGQGNVTSTNFDVNGNMLGRSVLTNDGHGNFTMANYDASGNKLSDGWIQANGTTGSDTFNADGTTESKISYTYIDGFTYSIDTVSKPDGSYQQNWSKSDGTTAGSVTVDANGTLIAKSWLTADGRQGVDAGGNHLLVGSVAGDLLAGASGHNLLIGGAGNDAITTGSGTNIIGFNKGDGQDILYGGVGTDNTLSLGGGIQYGDLKLSKVANDLILEVGNSEQITLKDWYSTAANYKSVLDLQVVADAMSSFDKTSADPLLNTAIQQFSFTAIANSFDTARNGSDTMHWSVVLPAHLSSSSNDAAFGGDLAHQYGKNGSLTGMNLTAAQNVINDPLFGAQVQALHPLQDLQGGAVSLG